MKKKSVLRRQPCVSFGGQADTSASGVHPVSHACNKSTNVLFSAARSLSALACLGLIVLSTGCAAASKRASQERLPALEPRVLGSTPTTEALARLARTKEKGKDNILFALTFNEPPPKELMPNWTSLDYAFSKVAGSGITYLPMDYFNIERSPTALPTTAAATMTSGTKQPLTRVNITEIDEKNRKLEYSTFQYTDVPGAEETWKAAANADGSPARYMRLRMALAFDRDVRTTNRGVILRALAKVGTEQIEPQVDISDESDTGRITVKLSIAEELGNIGPHSVVVTADVTRLGAEDRFGLIVSSNGGVYYDKATVSHGLAAAVDEAVGHAVFVLLCKVMNVNYEQFLAPPSSGLGISGRTEPDHTSSTRVFRVVKTGSHQFSSGDRLSVLDIHGNSVTIKLENPGSGSAATERRLFVGDRVFVRDASLAETLSVDLVAIRFGTTAEFRETVMAPSNAR
jgi:hypothetical protein